uniref:Uncharacterized protein n=1 Tax=Phakopsora pachyrhizi TaxID=170000 RepID=A0A0S1MIP0_PHAPC
MFFSQSTILLLAIMVGSSHLVPSKPQDLVARGLIAPGKGEMGQQTGGLIDANTPVNGAGQGRGGSPGDVGGAPIGGRPENAREDRAEAPMTANGGTMGMMPAQGLGEITMPSQAGSIGVMPMPVGGKMGDMPNAAGGLLGGTPMAPSGTLGGMPMAPSGTLGGMPMAAGGMMNGMPMADGRKMGDEMKSLASERQFSSPVISFAIIAGLTVLVA